MRDRDTRETDVGNVDRMSRPFMLVSFATTSSEPWSEGRQPGFHDEIVGGAGGALCQPSWWFTPLLVDTTLWRPEPPLRCE